MPRRAAAILLSACLFCACAVPALSGSTLAADAPPARTASSAPSKQAQVLRQQSDLIPYAPGAEVLGAYFTADEDAPHSVYGPVSAYAASRACPTAWLMEKGELARIERLSAVPGGQKDAPAFEFSLTLEEDCPGRVSHAVFVARPGSTPEAWLKWRGQFHGRKAEAHYGAAQAGFQKAQAAGRCPTAELRFLSVNGELVTTNIEQALQAEGRLAPVFALEPGAGR